MSEDSASEISTSLSSIKIQSTTEHPVTKIRVGDCETGLDASSEDLTETLRYRDIQCSTGANSANVTLSPHSSMTVSELNGNYGSSNRQGDIQIPIVGYEIMEERARFTVFKLRIEYNQTGECWYVFRRYTDFVRLCNKLKKSFPQVVQHLPRKKWLGNNFDPIFLEERVNGLQALVNAILAEPELLNSQQIQDFFCLNEPPICSESNQESRAMFAAYEDTIYQLKEQLRQKEKALDCLQDSLHSKITENENLKKMLREVTLSCQNCQSKVQNVTTNSSIKDNKCDNGETSSPLTPFTS